MDPGAARPVPSWRRRTTTACFACVALASGLVLLSWAFGRWQLGTLGRRDIPMAPSTAVLLLVLALVAATRMRVPQESGTGRADLVAGIGVLALSLFALFSAVTGLEGAIVRSLTIGPATLDAIPLGVMSPVTSVAFCLAGLTLVCAGRRSALLRELSSVTAVLGLLLASSVVTGYAMRVPPLYGATVPMAALTGAAFVLVNVGFLLVADRHTWPLFLFEAAEPEFNRRSLRGAIALTLLVTGAVIAATAGFLVTERREIRDGAVADLNAAARMKSREIGQWFAERTADGQVIFDAALGSARVAQFLGSTRQASDDAELAAWFSTLRANYGYDGVVLYDAAGHERYRTGSASAPSRSLQTALEQRRVVIDDLHPEPSGRAILNLFVPMVPVGSGENAEPFGAVQLTVDAARVVAPVLQTWPFASRRVETLLARQEGDRVLLLVSPGEEAGSADIVEVPADRTELPSVRALAGLRGPYDTRDYRGQQVLAVAEPIAGTSWVVVVKQDRAAVFAPFREQAEGAVVIAGLLTLSGALGVGLLWRRQSIASLRSIIAEQERRQDLDERLRSAIAASLDAFVVLGRQLEVVEWNAQAERTLGIVRADAIGHTFSTLVLPPVYAEAFDADLLGGLADAPMAFVNRRVTIAARRHDGTEFPAEVAVVPVRLRGDVAFSVTLRDITDRVAAETRAREAQQQTERLLTEAEAHRRALLNMLEDQRRAEAALRDSELLLESRISERTHQLEATNRELEAFAYSVSHDLRAPLRAIDGFAGMIEDDHGHALGAAGQRLLGVVRNEARRMGQLIDALLRFSRLGRQPLRLGPIDMDLMVRVVADEELARGNRDIRVTIGPLPPARADADVIRQVWVNLLSNAFKFTAIRADAVVEVGGRIDGSTVVYFVRDNGAGFDMRYAERLFGVFQRLHGQDEFEGIGVGLALVQRIVHRHGGGVWAEGAAGEGATFWFSLPAAAEG